MSCRSLHNGQTLSKSLNYEEGVRAWRQLTSTRREALSLYRDIVRASRIFMRPDSPGVLRGGILRENAQKEFNEVPEVVTRLLLEGRDAIDSALEKLAEEQWQHIEKERVGRGDHW